MICDDYFNGYYLKFNDKNNNEEIIYLTKHGLKMYFRENFNIFTYKEPGSIKYIKLYQNL